MGEGIYQRNVILISEGIRVTEGIRHHGGVAGRQTRSGVVLVGEVDGDAERPENAVRKGFGREIPPAAELVGAEGILDGVLKG